MFFPRRLLSLFLLLSAAGVWPLHALAQTDSPFPGPSLPEPVDPPAGAVNCFDHYTFGSVTADLQTSTPTAASGTDLTFAGPVVNNNDYPVVDGTLYVKIFKLGDRGEDTPNSGTELVDQFMVEEGVNLPARGEKAVSFAWPIPAYAAAGDYMLTTFFSSAGKFNLLGLTFTDDVVGNIAYFSVAQGAPAAPHFNREKVTVNDQPYYFAAYPPRVDAGPATLTAEILNPTDTAQTIPVTWQLYAWDALTQANLLDTKQDTVTLPANGTASLSYTVTDADHPVYYAVAFAHYKDAKSIIGVRFVRGDVGRVRLNFPGLKNFPLHSGQPATLFACVHGMGEQATVPGNRLVLSLLDAAGQTFHTYTYEGDITGAMMGLQDIFTPAEDYHRFTLSAQLYQNEQLVDQASLIYDCADLNPDNCPSAAEPALPTSPATPTSSVYGWAIASLLALVLIGSLSTWLIRRQKSSPPSPPSL
jgi:hypothetical protein